MDLLWCVYFQQNKKGEALGKESVTPWERKVSRWFLDFFLFFSNLFLTTNIFNLFGKARKEYLKVDGKLISPGKLISRDSSMQ